MRWWFQFWCLGALNWICDLGQDKQASHHPFCKSAPEFGASHEGPLHFQLGPKAFYVGRRRLYPARPVCHEIFRPLRRPGCLAPIRELIALVASWFQCVRSYLTEGVGCELFKGTRNLPHTGKRPQRATVLLRRSFSSCLLLQQGLSSRGLKVFQN